jgi:hypothetical protein
VAETLGRAGGRALGVEAAVEAIAWALAAVAVKVVDVEWRRADAFASLALLVFLTLAACDADRTDRQADSCCRISSQAVGALATERALCIGTDGAIAAGLGKGGATLVNVGTLAGRVGLES